MNPTASISTYCKISGKGLVVNGKPVMQNPDENISFPDFIKLIQQIRQPQVSLLKQHLHQLQLLQLRQINPGDGAAYQT